MAQPPEVIISLLLCIVRITLLYWWTTAFVFFENSQYSIAISIHFITIQYGLAFIDLLMVIGVGENIKEFLYLWVVTAALNMILVSQQLIEEISNITYWGLLMFTSFFLLLVMDAIINWKTTKDNCKDINEKGRRYSV